MANSGLKLVFIILVVLLRPIYHVRGQSISGDARKISLASAIVALPGYAWTEENPATLGSTSNRQLSLFVSRKYALKELQINAFNLAVPSGNILFAAEGQSFGFDAFRELILRATLAYPWKLAASRPIWVGISVNARQVRIKNYGQSMTYSLSFGLLLEIWHELYLGTSILHGIQKDSPISFTERFQTGLAYQFQEASWLLFKISKTTLYSPSLHFGLEYLILPGILFRTGAGTNPQLIAVGIGVTQHPFVIHLAAERHVLLGWTPALSIDAFF